MTRTSFARCSLAALGALIFAGCSGGPSPSASPGSGARASAPSGVVTSTTGDAGGSSVTCKQLTNADVQPVFTHTIASVKVTAAGIDGAGQQCVFSGADGEGAIDVLVLSGSLAQQGWTEEIDAERDGPVSVPNIGDRATRDTGDGQITAMKGDVYCSVTLGSGDDVPGIGKLEQAAGGTTHIAESAYQASAAALGTLCNRIFGSGNTTPDLRALTG